MQAIQLAHTTELDRAQWLKIRKQGIGGSDAAAIAGLNRWKSPIGVWLEKTGRVSELEPTERMYWGTKLEDIVAEEFSLRTGKRVRRCNYVLQHPEHPFMLSNVDRLIIGEKAGLECKTAGEFAGRRYVEEEFLPEHFLQVQHYLAVTGYERWYIAILFGGQRFEWKEILPDPQMIADLIKIESDFWALVQSDTCPEPDGSDACTEDLKTLYPEAKGSEVQLPADAGALIAEYDEYKNLEKKFSGLKSDVENKLKALLQDNPAGMWGDRIVKWPSIAKKSLDTKRLEAELPDVYQAYLKESTYRRFEIVAAKKAKEGKAS